MTQTAIIHPVSSKQLAVKEVACFKRFLYYRGQTWIWIWALFDIRRREARLHRGIHQSISNCGSTITLLPLLLQDRAVAIPYPVALITALGSGRYSMAMRWRTGSGACLNPLSFHILPQHGL